MKDYINNITDNAKVAIISAVAENLFELLDINDKYDEYKMGRDALDDCWKWLEGEEIEAETICSYIDSENGFDVMEFAQREKNREKQNAWCAVLDAVAYTTVKAYERVGDYFPPQIVDSITDDTIIICFEMVVEAELFKVEMLEKIHKYLLENYPAGNDMESSYITKEEIMKIVNEN